MIEFIVKYWIEFLFASLIAVFGYCARWIVRYRKEQEAVKEGLLALLHNVLYQECRYFISKREISDSEMKNIEYIYNSYHNLGGNGTGTELYERTKDLPLKGEK